jgi:asparagine synthase (glutamine-hydrolysing)
MCGIGGIFSYAADGPQVDSAELIRLRDAMTARGPDGRGLWLSGDGRVGLAHRRLAIIDLSDGGAQPMCSASGHLHIVFNGEIYNYRLLRSELEQRGVCFRSDSDTEVLLALYEQRGAGMVDVLRGMYAIAIYDERDHSLFLARDPFGIKPLYYSDDGRSFRWASQVRALRQSPIDGSPDPAGHVGYFLWGSVPEPYTLYRGIRALPAGTTLRVDVRGGGTPRTFCSIPALLADADMAALRMDRTEALERIRACLQDSVRAHMVADVPVGVFLSAGLDSASIAAMASGQAGEPLRTVTLGFGEYRGTHQDETGLAGHIARVLGTAHQTRWVGAQEFDSDRERLLAAMDQPSIDGVNTYFVSKATVATGLKVALSGLGGDELFGSYPSFRQIPRIACALAPLRYAPALGRGFRWIATSLLHKRTSPKYAGMFEYGCTWSGAYLLRRGMFMPWELPQLLDPEMVREGWRSLQPLLRLEETMRGVTSHHLRVAAMELTHYMRNQLLRDTDWASMAHSLEIRVPLVDLHVLRGIAPIVARESGLTKGEVMGAVWANAPTEVLNRPKTGFSIPVESWSQAGAAAKSMTRGLRGWAQTVYSGFRIH